MEWEYYVHSLDMSGGFSSGTFSAPDVTNMLNWYANQGWELVSTFPTARHEGGTIAVAFIFKRKRSHPVNSPPVAG